MIREIKIALKKKAIADAKADSTYLPGKGYYPYQRSVWAKLLADSDFDVRFSNLKELSTSSPEFNISEIISKIYNSSSKGAHSFKVKMVFIDTDVFSAHEVSTYS